jgi:hypothetical protein
MADEQAMCPTCERALADCASSSKREATDCDHLECVQLGYSRLFLRVIEMGKWIDELQSENGGPN